MLCYKEVMLTHFFKRLRTVMKIMLPVGGFRTREIMEAVID